VPVPRVLHERLAGKACLVILDDVWQLIHAKGADVLDVRSASIGHQLAPSIVTALADETRVSRCSRTLLR
jgi:hypothetical protein